MSRVYVLGAGAIDWGKWPSRTNVQMAADAVGAALEDAGLDWSHVSGLVAASSRFEGGMGWGLHANELLQAVNENGIPCINVGGACAAGAIAFHTAYAMVASGQSEVVVAMGAERMPKGFIPRPPGGQDDISDLDYLRWVTMGATNPAYWAIEAQRRMYELGTRPETLADVSVLMRRNAIGNDRARYREALTREEVLASPSVCDPLHLLQICPVSDGAAAVVLGSEAALRQRRRRPVEVAGCAVATGTFGDPGRRIPTISSTVVPGVPHTSEVVNAVHRAMSQAGVSHEDIDLLEMADNSAWHVLAWPEAFGFLEPGQADWMLEYNRLGIEGDLPINPSGGFLSFGEATTAQALLQIAELTWQLRGEASGHQVPNARVGLSAVLGLGANGAAVVLKG